MKVPAVDDFRIATATASTDATRRHLADAPAWAKAAIDSERERRGLPVLFGRSASTVTKQPRRRGVVRTLVGVAAPGISSPHCLTQDGGREILPEIIARSAWDCVAADLLMGRTFDFRTNHDGKPFVRSDDPNIVIRFDPVAGMLFTLRGEAADGFPWPAAGFCSIGFVARTWTKRMIRGQWVRQIDRMSLRHVALIPPHHEGPAYHLARVLSVPPDREVKALVNLRCDTRLAVEEMLGL
jgi:hypothetical protein